ncbi:MAG: hypothetical protein QNJ19_04975 [Woeseiaceae bacterium]|nr:hypothetical protein [Woeseiaceae bacterium]
MSRKILVYLGTVLCVFSTGCMAEGDATDSDSAPDVAAELVQVEQDLEIAVTVPSGSYELTVPGSCGIGNQAIVAEHHNEVSISVHKDAYNGMELYFSNNEDGEWEIILEPGEDNSELDGNRFRFSGDVPYNFEESDLQAIEVEIVCTSF